MPFILSHFISCTWGPCYQTLYRKLLVPHLESVPVLDYVLRSPVVYDARATLIDGISTPKMYPELYSYLMRVRSAEIRDYLLLTFGELRGSNTGRSRTRRHDADAPG